MKYLLQGAGYVSKRRHAQTFREKVKRRSQGKLRRFGISLVRADSDTGKS
jgi:hypothetical protein